MGEAGKEFRGVFMKHQEWLEVYKTFLKDFPDKLDQFVDVMKSGKLPLDKLDSKFFDEFKEVFVSVDNGVTVVSDKVVDFIDDMHNVTGTDFALLMKNKPGGVKGWKILNDLLIKITKV